MRTLRPVVAIPAATIALALLTGPALAGCGSDTGSGADTSSSLEQSAPPPPDTVAPVIGGTPTVPPASNVPSNDSSADAPLEGPVQIDVRVGLDSGPDRIEYIKAGADVTLNITNPDLADSFHVHGIDLEHDVAAGEMATFNFVVDTPGTYEVESHVTGAVLIVLQVV